MTDEEPTKAAKITFNLDVELMRRVRGTFRYANGPEGYRSLRDLVEAALAEKCTDLEARYNGGQPWPGAEAGEIRVGRPHKPALEGQPGPRVDRS